MVLLTVSVLVASSAFAQDVKKALTPQATPAKLQIPVSVFKDVALAPDRRFLSQGNNQPQNHEGSWLKRNWKWLVPLTAGAATASWLVDLPGGTNKGNGRNTNQ
jgi:hypothetical protein